MACMDVKLFHGYVGTALLVSTRRHDCEYSDSSLWPRHGTANLDLTFGPEVLLYSSVLMITIVLLSFLPTKLRELIVLFLLCHQVQFSISQLAASGLKVNRLDMYGEVSGSGTMFDVLYRSAYCDLKLRNSTPGNKYNFCLIKIFTINLL